MLNFEDFIIIEPIEPELIAGVFPKKQLTLLHGQQGSGKTFSTIKALNLEGIKPLYLDNGGAKIISNWMRD